MPASHAMGGLSAAYHDFFEANLDNPASLGYLQYTSLQLGFFAKRSSIKRLDDKQTIWSGNLDHLSLNIPIINPLNEALERRETDFSWGTSISLRPYSQVGYFIRITDSIPDIGDVQRTFTGSGGLYQIMWGNGIKFKNFAAGINLTYLYGKQSFQEQTIFRDLENASFDEFENADAYKGFQYRVGLLYEHPLDLKAARENEDKPSRLLSFGLFATGKTSLNIKSDISQLGISTFNGQVVDVDTAFFVQDQAGKAKLSSTWGAGFMYRHAGDFRFGFDYQAASWSTYQNDARPATFKDSYRLGAGLAWIPDANSITSYFKRVEYRAGFYTMTDPRVIENTQVKVTAATIGAGFPLILQRNIAWLQLGIDVGKRTGGDRLSDNFIRGNVGIILNDNSWFIKGKYD
ncbi:MAG TPA: hypothetical protein VFG10_04615 [Saprospiraceae bacterium]|nr:hypothetical protein [Saprospiraceae bacterium]